MADIVLVLVSAVWGATFVVVRDAIQRVPPFWLLMIRFLAAAALLAAWARIPRRLVARAAWAGLWLFAGYTLQTYGLRFVTPDTSAFLTSLSVLMVPLGEWAVHRRRPPTRILAAVVVAACGVWLLLAPSGAWNVGAWLTLGCAVAFAGQILATHGVERPDIVGFTVVELGVVGVASTVGWLMVVPAPHLSAPPSAWEAAALLAVLATALAFVGQTWAQTHTTPSRAALIFTLEPWFAVLVTALVTHHGLAAAAWLGAVLTFGAVALAEWGSRAASA